MNKGLFTSERTNWRTPKSLYQALDAEFHFDFDPCSTNPTFDGLSVAWRQSNYVNPPYGRAIKQWVEKADFEVREGKADIVVALVPARVDTCARRQRNRRIVWHLETS